MPAEGYIMDLEMLKAPFKPEDIEWRVGRCGEKNGKIWCTAFAYITARAIHDRLDEVCGMGNWQMEYREMSGGAICRIGISCPIDDLGHEWIWKEGGADATDFEAFKGMLSSSEKRAGVPWGIGRYLYKLDETFVETSQKKVKGWNYHKSKTTGVFFWETPQLPAWALPNDV